MVSGTNLSHASKEMLILERVSSACAAIKRLIPTNLILLKIEITNAEHGSSGHAHLH